MAKEFHFVSPAYPVSVGLGNLTCQLTIDHGCPKMGAKDGSAICQIRLDFVGKIRASICILMFLEGQQRI